MVGGMSPASRRRCRNPKPSRPGMFKSVRITSAANSLSFSKASLPSAAVSGVMPQEETIAARPERWLDSSSTIKTFSRCCKYSSFPEESRLIPFYARNGRSIVWDGYRPARIMIRLRGIRRFATARGMTVGNLVRQARRRILSNQLFTQGVNAGSAALAAFILLLLFGTQILSWQVALAIPLAAAAFGIYRVKRQMPSPYTVAQLVDQRLGLADNLSTALFFSEVDPGARVAPDIRRAQFEEAGRLAQSVDVRRAVPYTMPRVVYLMDGLALVAGSLFALRYGLSRRLDLKEPLASFLPKSRPGGKPVPQADNARRNARQTPETPDDGSSPANQDPQDPGQQDPNQEIQTPGEIQSEAIAKMDSKSFSIRKPGEPDDNEMASDDADSEGEGASGKDGEESQNGQQGDSKGGKGEKPQNGEKPDSTNASENSSLMSKMKEAFQNLLSKAKSQQNQQGSQPGKDQKSAPAKSQQGSKQNGKDGQPQNGSQQGDPQEGEDGQEAKNGESAQQGKGQGKSDSEQSSKQPGSGIGSQDGDKALRNAEQLAAMGKISEILGKRSATISGEATVEVQTTNQQLRTPYAQKGAEHTQGGAEISRDEVPVALQPYVQQYFEQVRKQSAPATPAVKK